MVKRLGEEFNEASKIDRPTMSMAVDPDPFLNEKIGTASMPRAKISQAAGADGPSQGLSLPIVEEHDLPEAPILETQLSPKFLKKHRLLPLASCAHGLDLAMVDPTDEYAVQATRLATGKTVQPYLIDALDWEAAYARLYESDDSNLGSIIEDIAGEDRDGDGGIERLKDLASEAPVIRFVNHLINRAIEERASDIHIEPFENKLKIRSRVDGVLRDKEAPPVHSRAAIISRIKIMARLNIAECRLAQDGRIRHRALGKEIDVRVSTVPTMHGESVVLRLLDDTRVRVEFSSLGFPAPIEKAFLHAIGQPQGIVLVTGPTGSGKTTTLYGALQYLNTPERKILTVEDPVEYQLEGVNQIQVKPQIGLTFASTLRSILRQDPDIIMLGEMRDKETAAIAVQAALTGHLVLSTLHTNDSPGAITRLLDMDVPGYLLRSTVNAVLAQRLVRRVCSACREPFEVSATMMENMKLHRYGDQKPAILYRAQGCGACDQTGYSGRCGIFELLITTDEIRDLVIGHAETAKLRQAAVEEGMVTMYENGIRKAFSGETTIDEVLRVTSESS